MANPPSVPFGGYSGHIVPGTIIFAVLGVLACIISSFIARMKTQQPQYKSDNMCIAIICSCVATFCMWLMWICTYMQQMNPIIKPEVSVE